MTAKERQFTPNELGALGVGVAVTIISALLTGPIPFPFNILASFGMGGTAFYGALKVLDPRTPADVEEQHAAREYGAILDELDAIAERAAEASRLLETRGNAERLSAIAATIRMITSRYRERPRDFAAASSTLLVLSKFDALLAHYVKVKCGQLFVIASEAERVVADAEGRIMPLVEAALENLGRRLDSKEASSSGAQDGALEDMLRSLGLIRCPNADPYPSMNEEAPDDTPK